MSALIEFSGKKKKPMRVRGLWNENEFDALDLTDYMQVFLILIILVYTIPLKC